MKYRGYIVVLSAVVVQTCVGGIYAWSVFVDSLSRVAGFSNTQTQLTFGAFILFNTMTMLVTGRIQDRKGPRGLCITGGVLLTISYLLSGYFGQVFWILFLSFGTIGGIASGCIYISTIPSCAKWFPKHKGLVCGLAVAGYGGGGMVLSIIAKAFFAHGYDAFGAFRVVAFIYGPAVILFGAMICNPPADIPNPAHKHIRFGVLISDRRYWRLVVAIFCVTISGTILIGNMKPLGLWCSRTQTTALLAISMFSIGSAAGRIVWGYIYDLFGGRRTIITLFVCTILTPMAVLLGGSYSDIIFLALGFISGFVYGGCFPVLSAQSAKLYGIQFFGSVYPLVLLAHGIAAQISPAVSGAIFDKTSSFTGGLIFASVTVSVGLVIYLQLSRKKQEVTSTEKLTII